MGLFSLLSSSKKSFYHPSVFVTLPIGFVRFSRHDGTTARPKCTKKTEVS